MDCGEATLAIWYRGEVHEFPTIRMGGAEVVISAARNLTAAPTTNKQAAYTGGTQLWDLPVEVGATILEALGAHEIMRLQHLDVMGCSGVTDASIRVVGEHCPQLQHLDVMGCSGVTDASIRVVVERCPQLQRLYAIGCSGVTDMYRYAR
ncbi:hypothetical protein CYMTET_49089 [Cymbomonas tetramitiformis]|uniref:Uncharacterized protein n=1 Tax=Cymbomonas tetramitiformis TaxID=36881 RepID=A0AAE0EU84_9CHLO|nr:hypothetical protein CYMTET_49089 [Cymbomonas tetramitiformis]